MLTQIWMFVQTFARFVGWPKKVTKVIKIYLSHEIWYDDTRFLHWQCIFCETNCILSVLYSLCCSYLVCYFIFPATETHNLKWISRGFFVAFDWRSLCSAIAMSHIPSTPAAHTPSPEICSCGRWPLNYPGNMSLHSCSSAELTGLTSDPHLLHSHPIENCAVDSWKTSSICLHSCVSALQFVFQCHLENNHMNQIHSEYIYFVGLLTIVYRQLFSFTI